MSIPWNIQTQETLTEFYKEHGQWARHYSTVRLTLGTFFITLALGILQFRWDKPELEVGILALLAFFFGVVLFSVFSKVTFDEMRHQLEIVNSFRQTRPGSELINLGKYRWHRAFSGLPVAVIFFLLFAALDGWWLWPVIQGQDQRVHAVVELKVPILLESGHSNPVTLDVPIRVSIPQEGGGQSQAVQNTE